MEEQDKYIEIILSMVSGFKLGKGEILTKYYDELDTEILVMTKETYEKELEKADNK